MAVMDDIIGPQFDVLQRNQDGPLKKWGDAIFVLGHMLQCRSTSADDKY